MIIVSFMNFELGWSGHDILQALDSTTSVVQVVGGEFELGSASSIDSRQTRQHHQLAHRQRAAFFNLGHLASSPASTLAVRDLNAAKLHQLSPRRCRHYVYYTSPTKPRTTTTRTREPRTPSGSASTVLQSNAWTRSRFCGRSAAVRTHLCLACGPDVSQGHRLAE